MAKINYNPPLPTIGDVSNNCYISNPLRMEGDRIRALLETLHIAPLSPQAFRAAHDVITSKLCTIACNSPRLDADMLSQLRTIDQQFSKVYSVHGGAVPAEKQYAVQQMLQMMTKAPAIDLHRAISLSETILSSPTPDVAMAAPQSKLAFRSSQPV